MTFIWIFLYNVYSYLFAIIIVENMYYVLQLVPHLHSYQDEREDCDPVFYCSCVYDHLGMCYPCCLLCIS